jgi:hypothetical protein
MLIDFSVFDEEDILQLIENKEELENELNDALKIIEQVMKNKK